MRIILVASLIFACLVAHAEEQMPQHKKLSILPLRLPPIPDDLPPPMRAYLQQHHAALEAYAKSTASIDLCSGLTKFSDATNAGYFLGFTRNDTGYDDGTPVFVVGSRSSERYIEFDGEDFNVGRDTELSGADAYNNEAIYFHTLFDSLDGYGVEENLGGAVTLAPTGVVLAVTTANNDEASVYKFNQYSLTSPSFDNARRFKTLMHTGFSFDFSKAQIVVGTINSPAEDNVGFMTNGSNALLGFAYSQGNRSTVDLGVSLSSNTNYHLEAVFSPGEKAEFYVNGSLVGEVTTNLPSGNVLSDASYIMGLYLRNTGIASSASSLTFGEFRFNQN